MTEEISQPPAAEVTTAAESIIPTETQPAVEEVPAPAESMVVPESSQPIEAHDPFDPSIAVESIEPAASAENPPIATIEEVVSTAEKLAAAETIPPAVELQPAIAEASPRSESAAIPPTSPPIEPGAVESTTETTSDDSGETMLEVSNEVKQTNEPPLEPIASTAPDLPRDADSDLESIPPRDATVAAPEASIGQFVEDDHQEFMPIQMAPEPSPEDAGLELPEIISSKETDINQPSDSGVIIDESLPAVAEAAAIVESADITAAPPPIGAGAAIEQPIESIAEPVTAAVVDLPVSDKLTTESPPPAIATEDLKTRLTLAEQQTAILLKDKESLLSQLKLILDSHTKNEYSRDVLGLVESFHNQLSMFMERIKSVPTDEYALTTITLRHPVPVAGEVRETDAVLGYVALAPGVSLNFLTDALSNGIARGK